MVASVVAASYVGREARDDREASAWMVQVTHEYEVLAAQSLVPNLAGKRRSPPLSGNPADLKWSDVEKYIPTRAQLAEEASSEYLLASIMATDRAAQETEGISDELTFRPDRELLDCEIGGSPACVWGLVGGYYTSLLPDTGAAISLVAERIC